MAMFARAIAVVESCTGTIDLKQAAIKASATQCYKDDHILHRGLRPLLECSATCLRCPEVFDPNLWTGD